MINNIKLIKKTKYPYGYIYEYDNGLKIIYNSNQSTSQDKIKYIFIGGSDAQKYYGLAHFAEHCMYLNKNLEQYSNYGFTSPFRTEFDSIFNRKKFDNYINIEKKCENYCEKNASEINNLNNEINIVKDKINELIFSSLDDNDDSYTKNLVKIKKQYELLTSLQESLSSKQKIKNELENKFIEFLNKQLKESINTFFDEVDSIGWKNWENFDESAFENEKQIIDIEYYSYKKENESLAPSFYLIRNSNYKKIINCGNIDYLKNITMEDVIEFKNKNYIKENFICEVITSIPYESIEETLIKNLSLRLKSNPKEKQEIFKFAPKGNSYIFYNNENTFNTEINFSFILPVKTDKLMQQVMSFYILKKMIFDFDYYTYLRKEKLLIYTKRATLLNIYNDVLQLETPMTLKNENVKNYIYSFACSLGKHLTYDFNEKVYYDIVKNSNIYNDLNNKMNPNYKFFTTLFTDDLLKQVEENIKNLSFTDAKNLIYETLQKLQLNVILLGDIDKTNLPAFEEINNKIRGNFNFNKKYTSKEKENSTNLVDLTPKTTALMIIDENKELNK